jgi:hypothetical protein
VRAAVSMALCLHRDDFSAKLQIRLLGFSTFLKCQHVPQLEQSRRLHRCIHGLDVSLLVLSATQLPSADSCVAERSWDFLHLWSLLFFPQ